MKYYQSLLFLSILLIVVMMPHYGVAETLGPISEETPPAVCNPGEFVKSIRCTGKYCDNIKIACHRFSNVTLGEANWVRWVSEEQGVTNCQNNQFIAGLACRGKYCDNISLYCVEVTNALSGSCQWTGYVSEENGGSLSFLSFIDKAGEYVIADSIECSGSYCDNKAFRVCEVTTN